MSTQKRTQSLIWLALVLAIIIIINVLGNLVYSKIDLTEDKRFTMMKATNNLLATLPKDTTAFTIEIYLEGEFPSEFRHLQNSVRDLLDIFRERSGNFIDYRFTNPLDGNDAERKDMQEKLAKQGIMPIQISDKRQAKVMLVFPSAIVRYGNRTQVIQLIELGDGYYQPSDIDASINFLEYKFASAIQKLKQKSRPRVVLLSGHGELQRPYTNELEKSLFEYYDIARLDLSQVNQIDSNINLIIVPKPTQAFSYDDQFKMDQYLMHGGRMLWLVDALAMDDDSLQGREATVPLEYPLDLQKFFFNYGLRVNGNLVLSYDAASFLKPLMTSQGQKANPKWFYYPLAYPYLTPIEAQESGRSTIDHPIVKNMDFVLTRYAASIDTVRTKTDVQKTILLRSSKYSRIQYPPNPVSLNAIDPAIRADAFQKGNQNMAVLLEGQFESFFRNRLPPGINERWAAAGNYPIRQLSSLSKMVVISDGDFASNDYHASTNKVLPMGAGYHPESGPRIFANREFVMNCVEYLLDDSGIIAARSREIKLRPLDQERAFNEETQWQLINLGLPLLLLVIFAVAYTYWRRKKYAA